MLTTYDLLLPRQVLFGWGRRAEIGPIVQALGGRAWIVCGSRHLQKHGILAEIQQHLLAAGIKSELLAVQTSEPTVEDVNRVTAELRQGLDRTGLGAGHWILALGGGSALDLAKAVAAMITNASGASVAEFLEGIGTGRTITVRPLPLLAIPTTSGTGSEATKNAVITSLHPPAKKSLRSPWMLPQTVLIDPELTSSCPPTVTATSGLDALTQLLESYFTKKATPLTRGLCRVGLKNFIPVLRAAYADGNTRWAREQLAQGAFLSGVALANAGLGLAHGVAAGLGGICQVPHGLACAVVLPATLRYNLPVVERELAEIAQEIVGTDVNLPSTGDTQEIAALFIDELQKLNQELAIPARLRDLGAQPEQFPQIAVASQGNSLSGNPRPVAEAELRSFLEELW
ncbi:MAG: iron-containing alcohol dehydrogenase [Pirellulales bacterium]|nr:iron-containing alcohol dehydrogenase [Pirellulales bacterium]